MQTENTLSDRRPRREAQKITELIHLNPDMTLRERWQRGKELRAKVPWKSQSEWERPSNHQDPIELIQEHDRFRLRSLLPIKYGRMAASAFGFLRGSAAVMAADLSRTSTTGVETMLSGDAHLSNFGIFASPERRLIFDINDFDETYPGPWEWDLKRLAASAVVAGKDNGFKPKYNRKLAKQVAKIYRETMSTLANKPILDVWYSFVDARRLLKAFQNDRKDLRILKKAVKNARTRTTRETVDKYTEIVNGERQFINNPPLVVRLTDVSESGDEAEEVTMSRDGLEKAWHEYVCSVNMDRRLLLGRYRIVDTALRVVGVGSVGTRCYIALLEANSGNGAIVLQQKEAGPSVLESYLPIREFANNASRVVTGQRLMQSESDIFLGWSVGFASSGHDYYWRQLRDMKGSIDVSRLDAEGFEDYVKCCSYCLALAHARSGDAAGIAGYLEDGKPFDEAIADFGVSYAEQVEEDYQELLEAIETGRIAAEKDV
jgi:uncharacterized protein (DUF2252 family)